MAAPTRTPEIRVNVRSFEEVRKSLSAIGQIITNITAVITGQSVAPNSTNDISEGWEVGSKWQTTDQHIYECVVNTEGGAVWKKQVDLATESGDGGIAGGSPPKGKILAQNSSGVWKVLDPGDNDFILIADDGETLGVKWGQLPVSALADGTDGELITWNSSGVATTVPVGTATYVLTSNGPGAAPTFQVTSGGGGSSTWLIPYAALSRVGGDAIVAKVGTTDDEKYNVVKFSNSVSDSIIFQGIMSYDYDEAGVIVDIYYAMFSATASSTVIWDGYFERIGGDDTKNIHGASSFASAVSVTSTVPATAGLVKLTSITFTYSDMDEIEPGDPFRFKIERDGSGDSSSGNAEFFMMNIRGVT